jgi:hypothetical protein
MDVAQKARMDILHRDADQNILEPLRVHKWDVAIEREIADGMIISAERGTNRS